MHCSAFSLPGLGTVEWRSDQMPPAVPIEDQGFTAGQHPTGEADLGPTQGGEAVIGRETRAGKPLRQESWESLGGKLTSWSTEAWITSRRRRRGAIVEIRQSKHCRL